MSKIFKNLDTSGLRQRIGTRTQIWLEKGFNRLEKLPPFFETLNQLKRYWWVGLLIAGFFSADLITQGVSAFFLEPSTKPRRARERIVTEKPYLTSKAPLDEIVRINPFCPGCPVPPLEQIRSMRPKDCNKAKPVRGSIKLVGTIVLSQPEYSVATVVEGADTVAVRQGDNYKSYGKVFEIRRNRICFEGNDGLLTFIELPDEPIKFGQPIPTALPSSPTEGISAKSNTEVEIKRGFLMEKLNDPNILFQAHAVPFKDASGNIQGFKILSIVPGSVYETMGFQPDDVIQSVNGEPMNSLAKAQELYAQAGSAQEVTIEILRNGQVVPKVFKIAK